MWCVGGGVRCAGRRVRDGPASLPAKTPYAASLIRSLVMRLRSRFITVKRLSK